MKDWYLWLLLALGVAMMFGWPVGMLRRLYERRAERASLRAVAEKNRLETLRQRWSVTVNFMDGDRPPHVATFSGMPMPEGWLDYSGMDQAYAFAGRVVRDGLWEGRTLTPPGRIRLVTLSRAES